MKHALFATFAVVATLVSSGRADPAGEVDQAVQKLLTARNFSWKTSYEGNYRTGVPLRDAYNGKTERNGLAVVTTARPTLLYWEPVSDHEQHVLIVYERDRSAAKVDQQWFTPRELRDKYGPTRSSPPLSLIRTAEELANRPGARVTRWSDAGYIHTPRPDLVLEILKDGLMNVKASGRGEFTAEISEAAVVELFATKTVLADVDAGGEGMRVVGPSTVRTSRDGLLTRVGTAPAPENDPRPRPGPPRPRYTNARGTVTFWIRDGSLVQYELRVEADELHRLAGKAAHAISVSISATLEDEGTTQVEWPEGAKEKLRQ